MKFELATTKDLPRIVEIYNQAVLTRKSTADLVPLTICLLYTSPSPRD